jgi:hypothetical protein
MIAEVLTTWIGTGTVDDPTRPAAGEAAVARWEDVTAQPMERIPPAPNLVSVVVWVEVEAALGDLEKAGHRVLWAERSGARAGGPVSGAVSRDPWEMPDEAEFAALRSVLVAAGSSETEVDRAVGAAVGARTRAAIADGLRGWLRALPKGKRSYRRRTVEEAQA